MRLFQKLRAGMVITTMRSLCARMIGTGGAPLALPIAIISESPPDMPKKKPVIRSNLPENR